MEQFSNSIVDIHYQQTGAATAVNALGMREMQALAYEARDKRFLLIKAPPASGKSRALMFIALDKLVNQGIKKVVVAVPEKSIGRSFKDTDLMSGGFFANWEVPAYFNLTDVKNEQDKKGRFIEFFSSKARVLVCAHATLRNATKELNDDTFNDVLLAIDEFHHTSADANSNLGDVVRRVMNNSTGHIVAMTGSYFRGDGIPVLRAEKRVVKAKSTFDTSGMKVLTLNIKKTYFDEIISGTKTIEYRELKQTTLNKYTYLDESDGKRYLRRYDALRLFVGYHKDRESALVQVTDITYNEGIVEYHLGMVLEVVR